MNTRSKLLRNPIALAALLAPLAFSGCPEPVDITIPVAKVSDASSPSVEAEVVDQVNEEHDKQFSAEGVLVAEYTRSFDVAPELLDDEVGPLINLMKSKLESGDTEGASQVCQGIILGLSNYDRPSSEMEEIHTEPRVCVELASDTLWAFCEGIGEGAGEALPEEFWKQIPGWRERLELMIEARAAK